MKLLLSLLMAARTLGALNSVDSTKLFCFNLQRGVLLLSWQPTEAKQELKARALS